MNKEQKKQQDSIESSIAVILTKVNYIEQEIKDIKAKLEKDYYIQIMDTEKALNDLKSANRELTNAKNKLIDIQKILNS